MSPSPRSSTPSAAPAGRTMVRDLGARVPACRPRSTSGPRTTSRCRLATRRRASTTSSRRGSSLAGAGARRAPRAVRPGRRRRDLHHRRRPDHRPARRHRRRRPTWTAPRQHRRRRSPRSSSPTTSATTSSRPRPGRARRRPRGRRVDRSAHGPRRSAAGCAALLDDADAMLEEVRRGDGRLAAAVPGDRAAGAVDHRARREAPGAGDPRRSGPVGAHRAHDQRHPLAVRAGRPPRRARPVLSRPPVQLHVQRAATGGCSSTRSPTTPSSRTTRSPRRRRPAPPSGPGRRHAGSGSCASCKDRDWYLTEIAERLELSKPTIKHHLAQLRAAGLVTLTEEGGLSYYSLRRDRLKDASADLVRYLS